MLRMMVANQSPPAEGWLCRNDRMGVVVTTDPERALRHQGKCDAKNPVHRCYAREGPYHRSSALAQVKPLPKAARHTRSPSLTKPFSQASHNAMGIDAAVVLP